MRSGRIFKMLAAAAAAALALAACTPAEPEPPLPGPSATLVDGGTVTVLEAAPFTSFNALSVTGNTATNTRIAAATHSGFFTIDDKLNLVKNEDFGKVEKVKDRPLTVKYTIKDGVQWSDGGPVTADDLFLQWAALSGYFNDATLDNNFAVAQGNAYFHVAGDHSMLARSTLPEIGDDGSSLTLEYSTPIADWESAFGAMVVVPAHIVAARTGFVDAPALTELMRKQAKGDPGDPRPVDPELRKVADFWNTGFNSKSMPDPSLALSNGPYLVKEITPDRELVLTPNADYAWGPKPRLDALSVKYESDPDKAVAALAAGTADVVSPPASAGRLAALDAAAGVQIQQGPGLGFDQLVLNFQGVLSEPALRTAFLMTVPRTDIVDQVAKPLDPGAEVRGSFMFHPAQDGYAESVDSNGIVKFTADATNGAQQDGGIARAKELLDGARPTVRILYNRDDPERAAEFALVAAAAQKAGFTITDAGKGANEWMAALQTGAFDAALYGWTASPAGSAQVPQLFRTGAASNLGNFSSPEVDQLTEELRGTTEGKRQQEIKRDIDRLLVEACYGLPLFQRTALSASSAEVAGVEHSPLDIGPWQSVANWAAVE